MGSAKYGGDSRFCILDNRGGDIILSSLRSILLEMESGQMSPMEYRRCHRMEEE